MILYFVILLIIIIQPPALIETRAYIDKVKREYVHV